MTTLDPRMQPMEIDFQSDSQGRWNFQIDQKLAPGQHIITVVDENNNSDTAVLYVTEEAKQPQVINTVTNIIPPAFFWALLLLFIIIVFLTVYTMRLARTADEDEQTEEADRRYHHTVNAILICSILLLITFLVGLYVNRETNFLNRLVSSQMMKTRKEARVSGQIIDPVTLEGVKGVDLVVGDTNVRTSESGQYVFGAVNTAEGVRLTYPNLIRALVLLPSTGKDVQQMDLHFDADMFNVLVQTVDLEMRGIYSDIYVYLAPEIKAETSMDKFVNSHNTIFTPANIVDQQIYVVGTKIIDNYVIEKYGLKFNKAVEVSVKVNDKIDTYYFTYTADGWRLLK
ncbi:hypothetical protein KKC87_03000 [Patescibacteria group bacterium]|nr:hypothetical protein [Patescibacteria group bacterium]